MAASKKLDPEKAARALAKRLAESPAFTAEAVCGNFPEQLAYLKCRALRVLAVASRRAGKSWANAALLLLTALATDGVVCLYIGLTMKQVKRSAWKTIKALIRKFKIPTVKTLEDMEIHLPNGSRIYFGSMSDIGGIDAYLGDSLAGGVCILDEIQSVPLRIIVPLVEDILEPALTDTTTDKPNPGRMVVSGTFRLASGYLWQLWNEENEFTKFNWNRLQNPHLTNQQAQYDAIVAKKGLTPRIARDWLGVPKFDASSTAYRYDPTVNSYRPQLAPWSCDITPGKMIATAMPANCDTCAVGIDPGRHDRFAIVWWYWHSRLPSELWQGGEWVTERNHGASWPEAGKVLDVIDANVRGGITFLIYDAGGADSTLDLFSKTVGHRYVTSAQKVDLFGRVERMASLFEEKKAHVIAGSKLELDYQLAAWDPDARADFKYKWAASGIHPDVADAAGYGAEKFWDVAPAPPKTAKTMAQEEDELFERAMRVEKANTAYGLQSDDIEPQYSQQGSYGPPKDY